MTRTPSLVLAFCGLLLLGSTAAFLLYVSLLSIAAVILILATAMFMFVFGLTVERRRRVSEIPSEVALPQMQGAHTLIGSGESTGQPIEASEESDESPAVAACSTVQAI